MPHPTLHYHPLLYCHCCLIALDELGVEVDKPAELRSRAARPLAPGPRRCRAGGPGPRGGRDQHHHRDAPSANGRHAPPGLTSSPPRRPKAGARGAPVGSPVRSLRDILSVQASIRSPTLLRPDPTHPLPGPAQYALLKAYALSTGTCRIASGWPPMASAWLIASGGAGPVLCGDRRAAARRFTLPGGGTLSAPMARSLGGARRGMGAAFRPGRRPVAALLRPEASWRGARRAGIA